MDRSRGFLLSLVLAVAATAPSPARCVSEPEAAESHTAESLTAVGRQRIAAGDVERGVAALMRAASLFGSRIASDPQNLELYLGRAAAYRALERYDDALNDYRRALDLGAEKRWIALELGTLTIERALRGSPPLELPADIR